MFLNGVNKQSNNWIKTEQQLHLLKFNYYKIFNNFINKILVNSVFINTKTIINGPIFFFKPACLIKTKVSNKKILIKNFELLLFNVLIVKLNNKIYSKKIFENIKTLFYKNNLLVFYQFNITKLKYHIKL
jgi:hypothetical protein